MKGFAVLLILKILKNDFIVCHCGAENPNEMQNLLKQAGYAQSSVRFVIDIQLGNNKSSIDPLEIKGVPTLIVLNKSGMLAWKGRYCAYEYSGFEYFMHHTLSEVNETKCPISNCDICLNDIYVERELIGNYQNQILI